ncbi:hypothetical protein Tco_1185775 [Tanacetum coccineum]
MRPLTYPKLFLGDTKKIPKDFTVLTNATEEHICYFWSCFGDAQLKHFKLGDNYVNLNGNITQGFRKTEVAIGCVDKQLSSLIIVTENLYKTVAKSNTHEFRTDITKLKMSLKFLVTSFTSLAWSNTSRLLKIKSTKATMDSDTRD